MKIWRFDRKFYEVFTLKSLILFPFLFQLFSSFGQTYEGVILNKMNQEPVPFAAIRVPNKSKGTICNEKGQFKLAIGEPIQSINISCIGFESIVESLNEQNSGIIFYLNPVIKSLDEITIKAVSTPSILHSAFTRIKDNYLSKNTLVEGYYEESVMNTDTNIMYRGEAYLFAEMPSYSVKKIRNIRLLKQRCFKQPKADSLIGTKFYSGIYNFSNDDFVRQRLFLLDATNNTDYEYKMEDKQKLDSMTLYKISFKNKQVEKDKPTINGVFFIDSASYAYVKIVINIDPRGNSIIGNYVRLPETREMTYQKVDDKWMLSHWQSISKGVNNHNLKVFSTEGRYYTTNYKANIDKKKLTNAPSISKWDIFSDFNYDEEDDFWKGFSVVQEIDIENRINRQLKKNHPEKK